MPKPEAVYRSDDESPELKCLPGPRSSCTRPGSRLRAATHVEAALGGRTPASHCRHRRAILGRWYVGSLIRGDRPDRPRALTMAAPRPTRR